jgi:hypothetical protein
MSLYDTIDALPAGKRLKYEGADGVTIEIEPLVRIPGRLDVVVRKQPVGPGEEPNHEYLFIDGAWCAEQEQALRDLGIGPDRYTYA